MTVNGAQSPMQFQYLCGFARTPVSDAHFQLFCDGQWHHHQPRQCRDQPNFMDRGTTNYNGTPSPGWGTGEPVLTPAARRGYQFTARNHSAAGLVANGCRTNPLSFPNVIFNKACLVILVTNTTTHQSGHHGYSHERQQCPTRRPVTFSALPTILPTNTALLYQHAGRTAWEQRRFGASYWLSTNSTFSSMTATEPDQSRHPD